MYITLLEASSSKDLAYITFYRILFKSHTLEAGIHNVLSPYTLLVGVILN